MTALVLAHAAVTWALVGLIWTIQLVHYPLFARIDSASLPAFASAHAARITPLVAPLMLAELLLAATLALRVPPDTPASLWWASLGLLVVIWVSTGLVQAPLHGHLQSGSVSGAVALLVVSNWVRTAAWTLRGGVAAWSLWLLLH